MRRKGVSEYGVGGRGVPLRVESRNPLGNSVPVRIRVALSAPGEFSATATLVLKTTALQKESSNRRGVCAGLGLGKWEARRRGDGVGLELCRCR